MSDVFLKMSVYNNTHHNYKQPDSENTLFLRIGQALFMKRINLTIDEATLTLLHDLAEHYYQGNKSKTVRSALESLAAHSGHMGWVIRGYVPVATEVDTSCHTCQTPHQKGEILYRPVFERGRGPDVYSQIPSESWMDCTVCAEQQFKD